MVGIQGLGGIPEPKPERPAKVRDGKAGIEETSARGKDGVVISSEAQAAAKVTQLLTSIQTDADIRADKVAGARERLERGDYKKPEVVMQVARKISKYLP
jgi:hypothetical protein